MEYDEVLYKLIDKVLVLDLKIQKNERSNLISSGKKHQKTNELCLISVGMNANTNTTLCRKTLPKAQRTRGLSYA